jgi:drug/metabolite transporter (DMT)-like permease
MWFTLALGTAVIYAAQWAVVRASHMKMPSSLMAAAHHILAPILAAGVFFYPMPNLPIVWIYLGYVFLINPAFSWMATHAVQRIPVSLSQPLSGMAIISSTLAGYFLFNVNFPPLGLLGITLGFAGLWLLYHANWSEWKRPHPWILTVCTLNFGIMATLSGQVLRVYPYPLIVSGIGLSGALLLCGTAAIIQRKKIHLRKETIAMFLFIAISNIIGEIILNTALGMAPAAYVVSTKRVSIILTALIGYAIFKERQTPLWRLTTATVVLTIGVALMAIR